MALRVSDKTVVNTNFLEKLIAGIYGQKYTERVKIIPNGVDLERYGEMQAASIKSNGEKRIALSAFRMMPSKNWRLIMDACPYLGPEIEWWIAGDGPDLDESKTVISNRNLDGKLKALGARNDMAALYRLADLFVHPSMYDNYPTVVMEASVSGLPVILLDPDTPGSFTGNAELMKRIPECVTAKDTGEDMAKAINSVLADMPPKEKIAMESRELNDHKHHVEALLALIQDELKSGN